MLAANPDELKKKALMEHLENKAEPLPGYMIEILESLTGNITYKTILQGQMAYYGSREARAAGILLRDMLNDSIRDEEANDLGKLNPGTYITRIWCDYMPITNKLVISP